MNEDKASPDLRFLIRNVLTGTSSPASLQNVNTALLPNGACCWITFEQSLWALNKDSTALTVPGVSLKPGSGPGAWFRVTTSDITAGGVFLESTGAGFNSYAVDGNWQTSSSSNFLVATDTAPNWSLTALGGILTYSGPARPFFVTLCAAARVGNVDTPRQAFLGVSKNDDLTGAATAGTSGAIDSTLAVADVDYSITTVRRVSLVESDTLRPKMAGPAGAVTLAAVIRMIVIPG